MNEYNDLFETEEIEKDEGKEKQSFDREAWLEKKRTERAEAYALLDKATEEITSDGEKFRDYLNTQSHFDRYSVSNALLIAYQHPGATKVADFNSWKEEDVSINKGEKGFILFEPGSEFTREDGSTGFSVNVKKVFDISQTSNSDVDMRRKMPDERTALKALVSSAPCKITMVEQVIEGDAKYSIDKNTIFISGNLSANRIFRSISRELSTAKIIQRGSETDPSFAARCSSYILSERYGFDTGDFSFDDVKRHYLGMDNKEIRKDLGEIRGIANEISQEMGRHIDEMDKVRKARDDGAR